MLKCKLLAELLIKTSIGTCWDLLGKGFAAVHVQGQILVNLGLADLSIRLTESILPIFALNDGNFASMVGTAVHHPGQYLVVDATTTARDNVSRTMEPSTLFYPNSSSTSCSSFLSDPSNMSGSKRTVLITGCSDGGCLGAALAVAFTKPSACLDYGSKPCQNETY